MDELQTTKESGASAVPEAPREIVLRYEPPAPPREVVLRYEAPGPEAVVERYIHRDPLPGRRRAPRSAPPPPPEEPAEPAGERG